MRRILLIAAKSALALLSLAGVGLLALAVYFVWYTEYGLGLPNAAQIAAVSGTGPACKTDWRGTYVPLAEIPPLLQKAAILDAEPDFYERWPNPFVELALAMAFDHKPRPSHIAGSVTRCLLQSLAPNCCRGGLDWPIGNFVMTDRVARTLSRDRILEIYLNESYLGRGSYGFSAASAAYFGKPLGQLSIDEIALLTVLPRMPSMLDRPDRAKDRRNVIIDRMLQAGIITTADWATARKRPVQLRERPAAKSPAL